MILIVLAASAAAQVFEAREFDKGENAGRYQALIQELRCLVCQNQNLADSNAPLAADLRQITYDMIREGKSDQEIIDFMVARYGEFVLYRPPLNPNTALLWGGPLLLLAFGMWLLLRHLRRRASRDVDAVSIPADERARLRNLLEDEHSDADRDQRR
jgi:cytochrome c-type biogenesis protein CcmH